MAASMPRSRQARITRRAISPRFATRIFWNIFFTRRRAEGGRRKRIGGPPSAFPLPPCELGDFHPKQNRAEIDRLAVLGADLGDRPRALGGQVVEELHRFELADDRVRLHLAAGLDVIGFVWGR